MRQSKSRAGALAQGRRRQRREVVRGEAMGLTEDVERSLFAPEPSEAGAANRSDAVGRAAAGCGWRGVCRAAQAGRTQ